jgi:hypothetical protein
VNDILQLLQMFTDFPCLNHVSLHLWRLLADGKQDMPRNGFKEQI